MKCQNYGKEFDSTNPKKVYCSAKCCGEYQRRKKSLERESRPKKICLMCGKEFTPWNKAQKYCSETCQKAHSRETFIKTYGDRKIKVLEKRICPQCGKEFETQNSQRIFCSTKCCTAHRFGVPPTKPIEPQDSRTLSQWISEARECNLDYGSYRALIKLGKTFEELKAQAEYRSTAAHARFNRHKEKVDWLSNAVGSITLGKANWHDGKICAESCPKVALQ